MFRLIITLSFLSFSMEAQTISYPEQLKKTMIAQLKPGDSLLYYQCHVEEAIQQLSTTSGQTLTSRPQQYSITEKFIIIRDSNTFRIKYYLSSYTNLPNRKFSGLKIREKTYWNYKFEREAILTVNRVKILAALENKGREPNEYDFAITKYNSNQLIIRHGKDFKQLIIEGDHVISKLMFE